MDLDKLYSILGKTTVQLRKGDVIHGTPQLVDAVQNYKDGDHLPGGVVTFDMMPHESEARQDVEKIDMELLTIGVNKEAAEQSRAEFIALLNDYPQPDRLASGPSYIEVGAEIGDQGAAFQMFALGQVLGLWKVVTPKMLGATGEMAKQMAGSGYIMITGYQRAA